MQFSPQARIEVLGCTSGLGDLHKAPLMGEHGEPLMRYTVSNGMRFSGFSQVAIISYMAALQYRGGSRIHRLVLLWGFMVLAELPDPYVRWPFRFH